MWACDNGCQLLYGYSTALGLAYTIEVRVLNIYVINFSKCLFQRTNWLKSVINIISYYD